MWAHLPRALEGSHRLGRGHKHIKALVFQNIHFFAHQTRDGRFCWECRESRLDRALIHFLADANVLITHPAGTEPYLPNR